MSFPLPAMTPVDHTLWVVGIFGQSSGGSSTFGTVKTQATISGAFSGGAGSVQSTGFGGFQKQPTSPAGRSCQLLVLLLRLAALGVNKFGCRKLPVLTTETIVGIYNFNCATKLLQSERYSAQFFESNDFQPK